MAIPIACRACGTKLAATRDRCPRCRAAVVHDHPANQAATSRRLAQIAAGLVGVFVAGLTGLWLMQDSAPVPRATSAAPADPMAARRQAPAAAPDAAVPDAAAAAATPRAFLDAAGAGTVAYGAGDYGTALARFEEAVQRNPQDAEALSNLGQILVRLNRTAESLPYFERATALNPDRWTYRFNYARALGLLQRWDEAIASYKQAQELFPQDYVTTFNLGLALHQKGDEVAAVEEYRKAIALEPGDASFRMALAISYERMGKKADAAVEYAEYLRLSPEAADADKVRARIAQLAAAPPGPAPTAGRPAAGNAPGA